MRSIRSHAPAAAALLGLIWVAVLAGQAGGQRLVLATLIGGLAGVTLYHATFGFTGAWRRIVTEGRGTGLRAQFLLVGLTAIVSYPLIASGGAFGFVNPIGVGMIFGAFLFGIGMQLGGGCGSGTLFTAGGGSTRMMLTLAAFVAGSLIGSLHLPWWAALPRIGGVSVIRTLGVWPALALTLAVLAALTLWSLGRERRLHGSLERVRRTGSILTGPWSPWLGALGLAVVSVATLLVLGRPWGITSAFAVWGGKIAEGAGADLSSYAYWASRGRQGALDNSVFSHATSVMNFGIILGAMLAAGLAGRWAPKLRLSWPDVWTAVAGGLAMGYGARLAYGCNIGGFLGGVISGSLHGWVWLVAAFVGSTLVVRLRMPPAPLMPQNAPS